MLERLTKPQNTTEYKPYNLMKNYIAGFFAVNIFSITQIPKNKELIEIDIKALTI